MKRKQQATASGEDYLEAILVNPNAERSSTLRGYSPAHGSIKTKRVPCSQYSKKRWISHNG